MRKLLLKHRHYHIMDPLYSTLSVAILKISACWEKRMSENVVTVKVACIIALLPSSDVFSRLLLLHWKFSKHCIYWTYQWKQIFSLVLQLPKVFTLISCENSSRRCGQILLFFFFQFTNKKYARDNTFYNWWLKWVLLYVLLWFDVMLA